MAKTKKRKTKTRKRIQKTKNARVRKLGKTKIAGKANLSKVPFIEKIMVAVRAEFLTASILPALLAASFAFFQGSFMLQNAVLAILAVILAHAGTNMINDYYDYLRGNYPKNKQGPTGGSFAIQAGLFSKGQIFYSAIFSLLLSSLIFIYLWLHVGIIVLLLGLMGVLIGFFYTAPPLSLGYRRLGEAATFIGMGPVLFGAVYYSIAGQFSLSGLALSAFSGALVANILLAAQIPDIHEDRKAGKRTLASLHGPQGAALGMFFFTLFGIMGLAVSYLYGLPIIVLLAALPGIWLSHKSWKEVLRQDYLGGVLYALKAQVIGILLPALALVAAGFFNLAA